MPRPRRNRQLSAPLWVMAYGDLMSLLLVFFIFVCSAHAVRFERSGATRAESSRVAFAEEGKYTSSPSLTLDVGSIPEHIGPGAPLLVSVFFDRGKDDLPKSAKDELKRVAPALWSCRVPVVVAGYVSPLVDPAMNEELGDADRRGFRRAMAVVRFLESDGAVLDGAVLDGAGPSPPRFLPASGGLHGGPVVAHLAGLGDGRDRVDIYAIARGRS